MSARVTASISSAAATSRNGCRQRTQMTPLALAKGKSESQKQQAPNKMMLQTVGGLAAVQLAFVGAASAHPAPMALIQAHTVHEQHTVLPVADTAGFFDFLGLDKGEKKDSQSQLAGTGGADFNEKGGPKPSTPEAKELSSGYASGSDSLPVPDVGKDVDVSGFTDLNKPPEEGTLSKQGEKSPVPS